MDLTTFCLLFGMLILPKLSKKSFSHLQTGRSMLEWPGPGIGIFFFCFDPKGQICISKNSRFQLDICVGCSSKFGRQPLAGLLCSFNAFNGTLLERCTEFSSLNLSYLTGKITLTCCLKLEYYNFL